MRTLRRIVVGCLVAVAATGAIGWAISTGPRDAVDRSADGTRVRDVGRAKPAVDASATHAEADLAGARDVIRDDKRARRRALVVVVEGPAGVVAGATVTIEPSVPFVVQERSIEAPKPTVRRASRVQIGATDAAGRAAFILFADDSVSIDVTATGFMPRSTTHWFDNDDAAGAKEEARVRLEPGAKVEGKVVDADGAAIVGAAIRTANPDSEPEAVSDQAGAFRFWVDMTTQQLSLFVAASGFVDKSMNFQMWNGLFDPPSIVVRMQRPVPRGTVDVTVRNTAGRPIAGAHVGIGVDEAADASGGPRVRVELDDEASWTAEGETDAAGRCVLLGVPLGIDCHVSAQAAWHAGGDASGVVRLGSSATPGRAEIVLTALGSLVVTVLDSEGRRAAGKVELSGAFNPDPESRIDVGVYRIRFLATGAVRVTARMEGQLPATGTAEIRAGVESALTLRLGKGVAIRGTVVDRDGRPIEGAFVEIESLNPSPDDRVEPGALPRRRWLGTLYGSRGTVEGGEFAFEAVLPGGHRLEAIRRPSTDSDVGFRGSVEVEAPAEGVRLVVRALGIVTARLLRPDGKPFEGPVSVRLGSDHWMHVGSESTNDGTIAIAGVEDGELELVVEVAGYAPLRAPVTMSGGRTIDLGSLRLSAGETIQGRVVDATGRPVELAKVTVNSESVVTREDGTFEFEHLSKGRHDVSATAEGFAETTATAEVPASREPLELRLSRGGVVRGAIRGIVEPRGRGEFRFVRVGAVRVKVDDFSPETKSTLVVRRPDGRYFVALEPGAWTAEWWVVEAEPVVVGKVTIEEGAARDLDLAVPTK